MDIDFFVNDQLMFEPQADKQVLYFIADFLYHEGSDNTEIIRHQFHAGYCYYFAHMLKTAFDRGEVCLAAPYGHFVWKDTNNICYDIEGVSESEAELFIPESFIGDCVKDFLHVRGVGNNTSKEEITALINSYNVSLLNINEQAS